MSVRFDAVSFGAREKRINEILGLIRTYGPAQPKPIGDVVKDIVYILHFVPNLNAEEQANELCIHYEQEARNGWARTTPNMTPNKKPNMTPNKMEPAKVCLGYDRYSQPIYSTDQDWIKKVNEAKKVEKMRGKGRIVMIDGVETLIRKYTVNGVELYTAKKRSTVTQILHWTRMAQGKGFGHPIDEMYLIREGGKKHGERFMPVLSWVPTRDGDVFRALHVGKVA